jgi:hypothetical protein
MSIATCANATFEASTIAPNVNPNFISHLSASEKARVVPGIAAVVSR